MGGLADGSVGLVYKVHHAVVDGVSAAETFELLLDPGPMPDLHRSAAIPSAPRRDVTSPRWLLRESLFDGLRTAVRVGTNGIEGLRHPRPVLAAGVGLVHLLGGTTLAPRTSLNIHVGAGRRLATVDLDLAAVKRVGRAATRR